MASPQLLQEMKPAYPLLLINNMVCSPLLSLSFISSESLLLIIDLLPALSSSLRSVTSISGGMAPAGRLDSISTSISLSEASFTASRLGVAEPSIIAALSSLAL